MVIGDHVASILHLTDTHLFLDESGATRAPGQRSRLIRLLARFGVQDLDFATPDSVARLPHLLRTAIDHERAALDHEGPVIVVHSGDTEAFGASPGPDDFTGHAHLDALFTAAMPDGVVAVYGNHDVWPGSVSLLGLNGPTQRAQKQSIDRNADMIGALPPERPHRFPTAHGVSITFVPLNSVNSSATRNGFLANGRLSPHPPDTSDVVTRLRTLHLRPDDLNIAVLHHPPHFDRPVTLRDRLGIGRLEQSASVAGALRDLGINLVLSGHRHRLDPAFGEALDATHGRQRPLPAPMAQLVALSPTMHAPEGAGAVATAGAPRRGLCVYRVIADDSRTSVTIHRLVHPTDAPTTAGPTFEPAVISRLLLGSAPPRDRGPKPVRESTP